MTPKILLLGMLTIGVTACISQKEPQPLLSHQSQCFHIKSELHKKRYQPRGKMNLTAIQKARLMDRYVQLKCNIPKTNHYIKTPRHKSFVHEPKQADISDNTHLQ